MTPSIRAGAALTPVGWNQRAVELNQQYDRPSRHPPAEVVRVVNSKVFARGVEQRLDPAAPISHICRTLEQVEHILADSLDREPDWLAKMEHANAGLGNRRLPKAPLTGSDRKWVSEAMSEGPILLEQWLPRLMDLSTLFVVGEDAEISELSAHETVHTASGAVIGAIYDPNSRRVRPWLDRLTEAAREVARAVSAEGYWGPVCLDSFVWGDSAGSSNLRPIVEINARQHASAPWQRLAGEWGGCVYGRFATVRKFELPETYRDFERAVGDLAWDAQARRGILLTSPLWYEEQGQRRRPRKLGLVFRGRDRSDVMKMEQTFRQRLER